MTRNCHCLGFKENAINTFLFSLLTAFFCLYRKVLKDTKACQEESKSKKQIEEVCLLWLPLSPALVLAALGTDQLWTIMDYHANSEQHMA